MNKRSLRPVFVKIGGSFITFKDKPFSINYTALEKLVEIISKVLDQSIILGNGGGSFAHPIVKHYREYNTDRLIALCQNSTRKLNHIIVNYLVSRGINAVSMQTSALIYRENNGYVVNNIPLLLALENNLVPVVYGECILTTTGYEVLSTEKVFKLLSRSIKPQRIVLLIDVEGIYTCSPRECDNPEIISRIDNSNLNTVLKLLERDKSRDATGGVYGKVLEVANISRELRIDIYIVSGFRVEDAVNAIRGEDIEMGTLIRCY
ncbi:MAG: isopentenyl phosphate kinase [Thermoprotei archaeon]